MKEKARGSGACRLFRRLFLGGRDKEIRLESPIGQAMSSFFRKKYAVIALSVLVALFLFVFVGSLFYKIDVGYTDLLSAARPPSVGLRNLPRELRGGISSISSYSTFSLGVGRDGRLYAWGILRDPLTGVSLGDIPAEADGGVVEAAAGYDHAIMLTRDGRLVPWGNDDRGQLGLDRGGEGAIPEELRSGLDPSLLGQLTAGYQVSAMVYDGMGYFFGNTGVITGLDDTVREMQEYQDRSGAGVKKIALSAYSAVVLFDDGRVIDGGYFSSASAKMAGGVRISNFMTALVDKNVVDIAATQNSFAFLTSEGELYLSGANEYGECDAPEILLRDRCVSLSAGSRHFVALCASGNAVAFGHNDKGQCNVEGRECAGVFAGYKQTYLIDGSGRLILSRGLRGYLLGTDGRGRDILGRIIHGGKMTLTVGGVAVIISTLIAVLVGLVAGYFGGWVDTLLMRISEIFSAIPFLPFALLLSFVMRSYPTGESVRIFIIMLILGVLSWPPLSRLVRGQVMACREMEFVGASRVLGVSGMKIAMRHILPNVISAILVSVTLDFAGCLLTESSLSYLGFGVQQPSPSWGNMLSGANNSTVIQSYPWQWLAPAIFLSVATVCINLIGDALRDAFDPKTDT